VGLWALRAGVTLCCSLFVEVVRERHPQLVSRFSVVGMEGVLRIFQSWFSSFFYGWLPHHDVLCVVDAFLSEGLSVLIRLGLAWLRGRKRALKRCKTLDEFESCLRTWVTGTKPEVDDAFGYSYAALAEHGFGLPKLEPAAIARVGSKMGDATSPALAPVSRGLASPAAAVSAGRRDDDDDDDGLVLLGAATGVSATATAAATGDVSPVASSGETREVASSRWYLPLIVGRPPVLLPLVPSLAELALESDKTPGGDALPVLPPSVLVSPPSFSTGASPALSSLVAMFPPSVSTRDLRCLYSTSVHGWSKATLHKHTLGIAPLMVLVRIALPPSKASLAKSAGARSSPIVGFFLNDGIPAPPRAGMSRLTQWSGHPADFIFQLSPHVACFPAYPPPTTAAHVAMARSASAGSRPHEHPSSASPGAGTPRSSSYTRGCLRLTSDRFIMSSESFLAIGGSPSSTAAAIRLPETFSHCSGSLELLVETGILSSDDAGSGMFSLEPELQLLGIEAFGFVDGAGSLSSTKGKDSRFSPSTVAHIEREEAKERERAAELAEQQARAYGGDAAVAELRARVKHLMGDEEGEAAARKEVEELQARSREAASAASALRRE
jgi:hypothetical protein